MPKEEVIVRCGDPKFQSFNHVDPFLSTPADLSGGPEGAISQHIANAFPTDDFFHQGDKNLRIAELKVQAIGVCLGQDTPLIKVDTKSDVAKEGKGIQPPFFTHIITVQSPVKISVFSVSYNGR